MSRSRARLAADWFAKLRQNAVTQEVEHTDVVAAETEALEAKADAAAASAVVGPTGPQGPAGSTGPQGPAGPATYNASSLSGLGLNSTTRNNQTNTVVRTQSSGYTEFGWINTTSGGTTTASSDYYVNTNDGYIRKKTLANVRTEINGGMQANSVGSYMLCNSNGGGNFGPGGTRAGSGLRPTTCGNASLSSYVPAGSWRVMGYRTGTNTSWSGAYESTLWMRYA